MVARGIYGKMLMTIFKLLAKCYSRLVLLPPCAASLRSIHTTSFCQNRRVVAHPHGGKGGLLMVSYLTNSFVLGMVYRARNVSAVNLIQVSLHQFHYILMIFRVNIFHSATVLHNAYHQVAQPVILRFHSLGLVKVQ